MAGITLFGYGRMGKEVERFAPTTGSTIVAIYDPKSEEYGVFPSTESWEKTDVIVEFTSPASVLQSVTLAAGEKKPIVIGTTGWYDHYDEVKAVVDTSGIGLLYAQNFSVGVQLFLRIVREAAIMINAYDEYDISMHERHHKHKADAPSGTAYRIAEEILRVHPRKKTIYIDNPDKKPVETELYVSAERVGNVTGTHSVLIDGVCDSIELTHTARNREGFALGALRAAEWLKGKTGIFTIEDMIDDTLTA